MNTLLTTLMHHLEEEHLAPDRIERCIRQLAAILSTYDDQIHQLELEISNLKDKIKCQP